VTADDIDVAAVTALATDLSEHLAGSARLPDGHEVGRLAEDLLETAPHDWMVIGNHDPDGPLRFVRWALLLHETGA